MQEFDILKYMNELPSGAWSIVGFMATYILNFISYILKDIYNNWKISKLPSESDKHRYDAVMEIINPEHFYYFIENPLTCVRNDAITNLDDDYERFKSIRKKCPIYEDKILTLLEDKLFHSMRDIVHLLPICLYPKQSNGNLYTYIPDNNKRDQFEPNGQKIRDKIHALIEDYNNFRDGGNKIFRTKLENK